MSIIILLLIISLTIAGGFLAAYIWSVRSGQYDDVNSPSIRIFMDGSIKDHEKKQD